MPSSSIQKNFSNGSITVYLAGTELAYSDTGPPSLGDASYITVFGVHGMCFNGRVFAKLQAIAVQSNIRFVSVTRRDYPGSTAYSDRELVVLRSGTDEEKTEFLKTRGIEFCTFMNHFIQVHNIPAISTDGTSGGVVMLGWSLGSSVTLSAIAHLDAMPVDVQKRLSSRVRACIMHEPGSNILGLPMAPRHWAPSHLLDESIPVDSEMPFFVQWASSYFQHEELASRDCDVLSYIAPAVFRRPTVFGMSQVQYDSIIELGDSAANDLLFQISLSSQLLASYRKANFDKATRGLLPHMHNFYLAGEHSPAFGPFTAWLVQDDDKAHGGGFITTSVIPGCNHICIWDDPEATICAYKDAFSGE